MARLDFGVEVGMERFGAVHTVEDSDVVIISTMGDAQKLSVRANQPRGTLSMELDRSLANQ